MSGYSYGSSWYKKKNYREPQLLAELVDQILPGLPDRNQLAGGWAAHFAAGASWSLVLNKSWRHMGLRPSFPVALSSGLASGLAGVLIWNTAFKLCKKQPRTSKTDFFRHLIPAHFVYSCFVALFSRPIENEQRN